jgi:hypothetical protein
LNLKCDILVSKCAFKWINMCRYIEVNILSGHGLVPHPTGPGADPEAQRKWSEAVVGLGYKHLARMTRTDVSRGSNDMDDFALVVGLYKC